MHKNKRHKTRKVGKGHPGDIASSLRLRLVFHTVILLNRIDFKIFCGLVVKVKETPQRFTDHTAEKNPTVKKFVNFV